MSVTSLMIIVPHATGAGLFPLSFDMSETGFYFCQVWLFGFLNLLVLLLVFIIPTVKQLVLILSYP